MKLRVTVSVSAPVLRAAEKAGRAKGRKSRSAVVEVALGLLAKRAGDAAWEAELDAYYATRTKAEIEEERTYHAAVRRSLRGRDFDREGE
jgi:hypothetical protein